MPRTTQRIGQPFRRWHARQSITPWASSRGLSTLTALQQSCRLATSMSVHATAMISPRGATDLLLVAEFLPFPDNNRRSIT
jgi:hypothetical protein